MRCSTCGYQVRGKNHNEGSHHQSGNNRLKKKAVAQAAKLTRQSKPEKA